MDTCSLKCRTVLERDGSAVQGLALVPRAHMAAHTSVTPVSGKPMPSDLHRHLIQVIYTHTCRSIHTWDKTSKRTQRSSALRGAGMSPGSVSSPSDLQVSDLQSFFSCKRVARKKEAEGRVTEAIGGLVPHLT